MTDAIGVNAILTFEAIEKKQRMKGNFKAHSPIGSTPRFKDKLLAKSMNLRKSRRVLDIAIGDENFNSVARHLAKLTSANDVENAFRQTNVPSKTRKMIFDSNSTDAEDLPFDDEYFDAVICAFGINSASNQQKLVKELARVCHRRGKIGLACWSSNSFIDILFKIVGLYAPPRFDVKYPALWGTRERIADCFGSIAGEIEITKKTHMFRCNSAPDWLEMFKTQDGPLRKVFSMLDNKQEKSVSEDILYLMESYNTAKDGSLIVPSEYLEVVIKRT